MSQAYLIAMYVPLPYREDRPEILIDGIRKRSFGTLISSGSTGIQLTHLPFAVAADEPLMLVGHVARANPHWQGLKETGQAVASFLVDDSYISPGWYPSKAVTGRMVPTWNYMAIEARGEVSLVEDAGELLEIVSLLTARHENHRAEPWTTGDAPKDFTDALLKAIVGFRLSVQKLSGAWKLDQKKRVEDRAGAAEGLLREIGGSGISAEMRPEQG